MTASIYVGTYGKYNCGSLDGKWFDLEDYADKEEFFEACQEFHDRNNPVDDDGDPIPAEHEFMFQDHEGIPATFIGESWIDPEFWNYLNSDVDEAVKEAYMYLFGEWDEEKCNERYRGEFSSWAAMAEEFVDESGMLESMPENLRWYFDYEKYANDIRCSGDMCEHNDHFFWNN